MTCGWPRGYWWLLVVVLVQALVTVMVGKVDCPERLNLERPIDGVKFAYTIDEVLQREKRLLNYYVKGY